jgi:hypothetical protein
MLPNGEHAVVDAAKVRDYLLSSAHPVGRFKAAVFLALGYTAESWPQLQSDLLALGQFGEARPGQTSLYGQKYEVSGILSGPNGRQAVFTTVWLVRPGESNPRFITAFPE